MALITSKIRLPRDILDAKKVEPDQIKLFQEQSL
jgi:hypothetical protein